MSKWQFNKEEVRPFFAEYGRLINNGLVPDISPEIAHRVKASTTVTGHSTDIRVLQFHLWVTGQVFDKRYFKYEVQHDPVPRYTGTPDTNWAIQFWMNKVRGVYYERDTVVERVRREVSSVRLKGFRFEENKQAISLIHRFAATSLPAVKLELDAYLFKVINAVHPMFCFIIDAFGVELTDAERRKIIKGSKKPTGVNRLSEAFGSSPEFNRNVPKRLRIAVFERDSFRCMHCGFVGAGSDLHADHVVPVSCGGLTVITNLQTLCSGCNLKKGGHPES